MIVKRKCFLSDAMQAAMKVGNYAQYHLINKFLRRVNSYIFKIFVEK